ncbi:M48 family metallopeptidase [Lutibacter sp. B2]|nr:M48 family metallopeptidase [Lutibacter sp. B2]
MRYTFEYENKTIEFELIQRKRRTMEIRITPPDQVRVIAPSAAPKEWIIEKLKNKGSWIVKKLDQFKDLDYLPIERKFEDGEKFMYLGKDYFLKISIDKDIKIPEVKLEEEQIHIITPKKSKSILSETLEKWYRKQTLEQVQEKVKYYRPYFHKDPSNIRVKEQKKRWASCTYKDEILFNWRGSMALPSVLDYIVVHEMCHMVHKNHSKDFWALVESIIPDYKERRNWLKKYGVMMDV